uniref:Protein TIC 62, chloroplastic n=1 Tax=Anthurium amnicola TaxID=1678845 RepID=A0A1D1XDE9_9ARAE
MGLLSLHSRLPPFSSRRPLPSLERGSFLSGQPITSRSNWSTKRRCPDATSLKFLDFRPRAAGPAQGETESNLKIRGDLKKELSSNDANLAFVAGATGRVGSRTVRELLKLGFRVRAGVRSVQRSETLVQSVRQMKLDESTSEIRPVERLEIVECDLENQEEIGPAIGNASIVICCIGASEKEVLDVTGPYRIDYKATKNLIDSATVAKVDYFILLTSLGTNKIGFPAALLNLFWGVLLWKRKAEEALIASGLPYTIVRPGGMERPTDAFKETHNIVLANEDTYFGGLVSNLQVAELIAFIAKNRSLSFCKVVEVIAETTAPLTPMGELLAKIPSQRVDTTPKSPTYIEPEPGTAPSHISSSVTTSDVTEKESVLSGSKPRPLSPYVAYEDLKPPTSPTPKASSASAKK